MEDSERVGEGREETERVEEAEVVAVGADFKEADTTEE